REGAQMAAVDTLKIAVQGRGSHGAIPHESNDPFPAVASLIMNLQTIVSRNMDPQEPAVLSFGSIHGGAANNVIPEHIALTGTIRSFSPEARDLLHERVREIAQGTAEAFRCPIHVDIRRDLPAVLNDPLSYRCCVQAAKDIVGAERVVSPVPSMGGEDFALFQQIVPGCMFWLGVRNETIDARYPWHSPRFTADESALPVGAAVLARSAVLAMEALSSQA
ncbi:MAG TPA: amidohydrolase, partial [Synergistaceae bacterium]|nr:amidohydrolase [Synergistaceae bacterium]